MLVRYYSELEKWDSNGNVKIHRATAVRLSHLKGRSVDYVFTDPPFGSNIFYADCNFLSEAWLGRLTDTGEEAVINRSLKASNGGKGLADYREMMCNSFKEIARVLTPTGKAHIVFNSSCGEVWSTLVEAIKAANLNINGMLTLDKGHKSVKQNRSGSNRENVAINDVIFEVTVIKKKRLSPRVENKPLKDSVLVRSWQTFRRTYVGSDPRFVASDFYHYLIKKCALDKIELKGLNLDVVREFTDAAW
jgi:DNA modification methylase